MAEKKKAKRIAAEPRIVARADALKETHLGRHVGGFMDFVREQGVVGLAVGLVLGTQVKSLADALVESFINPFVGLALPGTGELDEKAFSLTFNGNTQQFGYGAFISVLISFLVIAAVIYVVVKGLKLDRLDKKKA